MKTRTGSLRLRCRQSASQRHINDRLKPPKQHGRTKEIQLIYAHFVPRVIFSVTEHSGYVPQPGNEFINTTPSSYKAASPTPLVAEHRPEVSQTSPAGVRKRIRLQAP